MGNSNRISFVFEWLKGIKIAMPNSKFISFCIGVLILALSFAIIEHETLPYYSISCLGKKNDSK